jgi:hypothetical protein
MRRQDVTYGEKTITDKFEILTGLSHSAPDEMRRLASSPYPTIGEFRVSSGLVTLGNAEERIGGVALGLT